MNFLTALNCPTHAYDYQQGEGVRENVQSILEICAMGFRSKSDRFFRKSARNYKL